MSAARHGGSNPDTNFQLRLTIERARAQNLPAENITRAIQRGAGEIDGAQYEEFTYEGYGPGGVAIMVELMSDNRNRTAGEIRYIFSRNGGNLGESGCVAWMFERLGTITLPAEGRDENELMMLALEAGANDIKAEGDDFVVYTTPDSLDETARQFIANGIDQINPQLGYVPTSQISVSGADAEKLLALLDALEEHDDVQNVFANFDISDEELERLEAE